jgi:hypothetical protein
MAFGNGLSRRYFSSDRGHLVPSKSSRCYSRLNSHRADLDVPSRVLYRYEKYISCEQQSRSSHYVSSYLKCAHKCNPPSRFKCLSLDAGAFRSCWFEKSGLFMGLLKQPEKRNESSPVTTIKCWFAQLTKSKGRGMLCGQDCSAYGVCSEFIEASH